MEECEEEGGLRPGGRGEVARNPDSSHPDAGPFPSTLWHQALCALGWPAVSWRVRRPAKGDRDTLWPGTALFMGAGTSLFIIKLFLESQL